MRSNIFQANQLLGLLRENASNQDLVACVTIGNKCPLMKQLAAYLLELSHGLQINDADITVRPRRLFCLIAGVVVNASMQLLEGYVDRGEDALDGSGNSPSENYFIHNHLYPYGIRRKLKKETKSAAGIYLSIFILCINCISLHEIC